MGAYSDRLKQWVGSGSKRGGLRHGSGKKKGGGVLCMGQARKKGGLRHGSGQKKGGLYCGTYRYWTYM